MSRRSATIAGRGKWLGLTLVLLGLPAASAQTGGYPPASVLLFVASWCAPCHAELARLPAITHGARPFRVLVVPFDDRPATMRMLDAVPSAQRWQTDPSTRRSLVKELAAGTSGLPFSVAIDGGGRPCGSQRKGLDAAAAQALVAVCSR